MDRAVTVSAASGTISAFVWQLAHEFLQNTPPTCPLPPLPEEFTFFLQDRPLDIPSLALGILVGLALGPCLDLCFVVRQAWRAFIRNRLAQFSKEQQKPLYRLA